MVKKPKKYYQSSKWTRGATSSHYWVWEGVRRPRASIIRVQEEATQPPGNFHKDHLQYSKDKRNHNGNPRHPPSLSWEQPRGKLPRQCLSKLEEGINYTINPQYVNLFKGVQWVAWHPFSKGRGEGSLNVGYKEREKEK